MAGALVAGALVLGACSGDDAADPSTAGGSGRGDPTATSVTAPVGGLKGLEAVGGEGLDGVVLARALARPADLPGFEPRTTARPFRSDEGEGLLICGEDLRAEEGLVDGVRSVLAEDDVQVTLTVSAAADAGEATRFIERFGEVAGTCSTPWTQPALLLGAGDLEAEVVGPADVGAPGPAVSAFALRTSTDAGSSDVVTAVLAVGPVVTAVTVAGPVDADLTVAEEAVAASARRSVDLVEQLG